MSQATFHQADRQILEVTPRLVIHNKGVRTLPLSVKGGQFCIRIKFLNLNVNVFVDGFQELEGIIRPFKKGRITGNKSAEKILPKCFE